MVQSAFVPGVKMPESALPENRDSEIQELRRELLAMQHRNKRLQASLEEQQRLIDTIFFNSPDLYFIKDTSSVFQYVNPAFCRFLGKNEEEIVGKSEHDFFPTEEATQHFLRDAEVLKTLTMQEGEWSVMRPDGRYWFRVMKTPLFDHTGAVRGVLSMAQDISRGTKAELEFERMFNLMPDMGCIASVNGYFTKVNKVWHQSLGYTEEELLSIPYTELIHPDDLQSSMEQIRKKLVGTGPLNFINRYRAKDGSYHWLEWRSTPVEENKLYAVARDITERIEQDRQTRLWADAFRYCAFGIAIGIPDSNVVLTCNEAFARMRGQTVADIEGALITDLYVPDDFNTVVSNIRVADRTGFVTYQAAMLRRDGSVFPVQMDVVSVKDDAGHPVYRIATMQDISERLESQSALRESEARFRSVVESAPDAIFIQSDGCFRYLNHRAVSLFGACSADELLGRQIVEMIHPDYRTLVHDRIQQLNDSQQPAPAIEERILRIDGLPVVVEASAVPFLFSGCHGALVFLRDISRRKEAEKNRVELELQLFQSQKIESIGRLAGGISHDLNNLLTPILGYSEMLLKRVAEPGKNRQHIEVINHAALKARELVRQLLAFSSRQALEFRMLDLNEVIREFEQLLRRTIRADIDIRYRLYEGSLVIQGDVSQLEQIIMNLAVNAEDAMPEGGELLMQTAPLVIDKGSERYYEGLSAGSYALLTVCDTGEGMDIQTLSHIFEPFFTTKPKGKGTGLGLSTVYGIVRQHGGVIQVTSDPGVGSCFRICIPLKSSEHVSVQPSEEIMNESGSEATVLVVEDDELVRKFVVQSLVEAGFTIRESESGEEALELVRKERFIPDLLLTDLVMRGMNGRVLFEKISQLIPSIRVIYMSGYTRDIISNHGVLNEGVVYLQKPFPVPVLLKKVRDVLQNGNDEVIKPGRKKPKPKL